MNKRNLIICAATKYANEDGGYLSRIKSEIEKIYLEYNIFVFLPEGSSNEMTFENKAKIINYKYKEGNDIISYISNLNACRRKFKEIIKEIENPIIYCEALVGSMWLLKIAKKANLQIVFDCHGTESDEILMRPHTIKRLVYSLILRYFEKIAVNSAEIIVTVSNKQYYKWNINKKHVKYPMIPSKAFFNENKESDKIRKQLNIPLDATVFVYSGGTAVWQMCDETVELYKKIEDNMQKTFFLILTTNQKCFKELIDKYSIRNYKIITIPYGDVYKYLDVADFGFCIRENHIVNNVASPTKILEYLSRNVKPIITDCIGDFSDELGNLNLACIMNKSLDNLDCIKKDEIFNGIMYVNKVKEEYTEKYKAILREL